MAMWISFWHLIGRSFVYMPKIISENWAGILLPFVVFVIREGVRAHKGSWSWRSLNWKSIKKDTSWLIGAYLVLFGWAVVHNVYDDHESLLTANSELRTTLSAQLKLVGKIDSVSMAPVNSTECLFTINASVNNLGEPTLLEHWRAELKLKDGTTIHGMDLPAPLPEFRTTLLYGSDNKAGAVLLGTDDLINLTKPNPIVTGGGVSGWIQIVFPINLPRTSGADLTLFFDDVRGNTHTASFPNLKNRGYPALDPREIERENKLNGARIYSQPQ